MPPRDRSPNASSTPLQPAASAGSLAERRCDPDRLLLGHLGFEPVGDAALFPEQRVTGEAERLRLEVAIRVEVEELVGLPREPGRDPAVQGNGFEMRFGSGGLADDRLVEPATAWRSRGRSARLAGRGAPRRAPRDPE